MTRCTLRRTWPVWMLTGLLLCSGLLAAEPKPPAAKDPDVAVLQAAGIAPDAAGLTKYFGQFLPAEAYDKRVCQMCL